MNKPPTSQSQKRLLQLIGLPSVSLETYAAAAHRLTSAGYSGTGLPRLFTWRKAATLSDQDLISMTRESAPNFDETKPDHY